MLRRRWITFAATGCLAAWFVAPARPAAAIGYYNLPGNFCQCSGYGNGGGYHACLVLGPSSCCCCYGPNETRLPYPPRPTCGGYGCASCGPMDGGEWLSEPSHLPPAQPQYTPSPAAMRPQILR